MNCRFWKLEITPLLSHLERLHKERKTSNEKVIEDMWGWMVCCVEGGNYYKKNSISLSQSTLVAKSIFTFSCLEILTNGRSPLYWLFRHSKKASSFPSAPNDCMPSSLKWRRMSFCLYHSRHHEAPRVGSELWGEAELGQGPSRQGKQPGRQPACPTILLKKGHWIRT